MLKGCRLELRVARAAHPPGTAGRLRFHPLRRRDEGSDFLPARGGDGRGLSPAGEDRGPVSRPKESTVDPGSAPNAPRPRARATRRHCYTPEAQTV